jgi:hypothetical protein
LHHVVPRSKSRTGREDWARNGVPLCFDCHRGWHDRRITVYHAVLTDAEFLNAIELAGGAWVERNYPDHEATALMRLDELVNRRQHEARSEAFDERLARVYLGPEVRS